MRWISIILLFSLFCSCTALKPVINNKPTISKTPQDYQPHFIETITVQPGALTTAKSSPSIHNSITGNTFTLSHNITESYPALQFKYAILMDVPVETLLNLKLFSFIDDWYGTPYHFGGNSRSGIDCSAFSGSLMTNVFGIGLPRMAKDQYNVCEHIRRNDLEEGDLVFFHTTRKGISHVGVYIGNNKFVHASLNYGVTISDLNDPYYARTFRAGGRVRQVTDNINIASGN